MEKEVQPGHPVQNLVVAKARDGRMIKGVTYNFGAEKKHSMSFPYRRRKKRKRKGVWRSLSPT